MVSLQTPVRGETKDLASFFNLCWSQLSGLFFLEDTENVVSWCPRVWNSILVYWLSEWPKNPLSHWRRGYRGFGRLYPARPDCLLNSCILSCYHITRTTLQAISFGKPYEKSPVWGPYASSDRVGKTCTALLEKRNERCGLALSEEFKNTAVIW